MTATLSPPQPPGEPQPPDNQQRAANRRHRPQPARRPQCHQVQRACKDRRPGNEQPRRPARLEPQRDQRRHRMDQLILPPGLQPLDRRAARAMRPERAGSDGNRARQRGKQAKDHRGSFPQGCCSATSARAARRSPASIWMRSRSLSRLRYMSSARSISACPMPRSRIATRAILIADSSTSRTT
ncbi:hypothetical protein WR25_05751 [Diploscapter pachys]|uniref:Uncharacterized protein n=1 Tax=Diploscapter pachys TaxID=2018661 RepID=A0A2A2JZK6_9BILA|nr:hypothetical protein WR25_05751 [Diploscapter pachys]